MASRSDVKFEESGASSKMNLPSIFPCLLCDETFECSLDDGKDSLLKHLLMEHKFVIADVNVIADFKSYLETWKERFRNTLITDFCTVIKTNSGDTDMETSEYYYLLCDLLPEDKELRKDLQNKRLESVIKHQEIERRDEMFSRICLFCKKNFVGNRTALYTHMKGDHSFNIGHPDNIVFGNELLNLLEKKLERLQCLYCEKYFKTWDILKEHMRKKQHKRINPRNSTYDKFYLINYLEMGKNWRTFEIDKERSVTPENENEDWNDWQEEGFMAVCLFCKYSSTDFEFLFSHMQNEHSFCFSDLKRKLNFYQQVKLINYIRKQVVQMNCVSCKEHFTTNSNLIKHMMDTQHFMEISKQDWDDPQYFFPTYENDWLLCMLGDCIDESATSEGTTVIPEDISGEPDFYLLDENHRRELGSSD